MDVLTHLLGPFPIGIWVVLGHAACRRRLVHDFLVKCSLVSWDTALRIRLQEDPSVCCRHCMWRYMGV